MKKKDRTMLQEPAEVETALASPEELTFDHIPSHDELRSAVQGHPKGKVVRIDVEGEVRHSPHAAVQSALANTPEGFYIVHKEEIGESGVHVLAKWHPNATPHPRPFRRKVGHFPSGTTVARRRGGFGQLPKRPNFDGKSRNAH